MGAEKLLTTHVDSAGAESFAWALTLHSQMAHMAERLASQRMRSRRSYGYEVVCCWWHAEDKLKLATLVPKSYRGTGLHAAEQPFRDQHRVFQVIVPVYQL